MKSKLLSIATGCMLVISAPNLMAHSNQQAEVTIKSTQLSDGLYVLFGQGGNIGLSVVRMGCILSMINMRL